MNRNRTPLEQNPNNTIELNTSSGVIPLTIMGFINNNSPAPVPLVLGYLTDNARSPTIVCNVAEARRLAAHIMRAADAADEMLFKLSQAQRA